MRSELEVCDAVSSFPYFPLGSSSVFVFAINKQLCCPPGMAVVAIDKELLNRIPRLPGFSLLDLHLYRNAIPVTYSPLLFLHLSRALTPGFQTSIRKQIETVCDLLLFQAPTGWVVNEVSPVLTALPGTISDELAKSWELYKTPSGLWQIFTYSHPIADYRHFVLIWSQSRNKTKREKK